MHNNYVQDFIFPDNVALPLGGDGMAQHAVIEMHYDNPDMTEGMRSNDCCNY